MDNRKLQRKAPQFKELTEKELMMVVPNNVTFGQYDINEMQENILTLIGDALQKHMTREKELPRDLYDDPYIDIYCDEAGGKNNKTAIKSSAKDLAKKQFLFRWQHPEMKNEVETSGSIITTIHDIKNTNRIIITFNRWAIPFLIYYGVGVGGTLFNKGVALAIRGNYAKRIYKIISSQRDRPEYVYNMEQFKKDLGISADKDNSKIERDILKPAQERIRASGSDVWFEYELKCRHPKKGRKPKADTIYFYIKTLHPKEAGGEQYNMYNFVYRWIGSAMKHPTNDTAFTAVEKLTAGGHLKTVYERLTYWDDQLVTGAKTKDHLHNSLLKMLRDDYGIATPKETKKQLGKRNFKTGAQKDKNEIMPLRALLESIDVLEV